LESEYSDLLDEFWQLVEEEGAGTQEALSQLLQRADKLLAVLKSPQRIEAIAAHIVQHYQENVLPSGFKALVVTPDREACALYKAALDQYLPEEWSMVVYSQNAKADSAQMKAHYLDDDAEKRVRKAFRDPEKNPKLLIVTQKLLTGYDAPVAYAMYLDRPLKDHTLLQAIARVNRPYPDKKSGLIVDYIGIFKDLQRALSGNQSGVDRGLIDLDSLKRRFHSLMAETQTMLAPIDPTRVRPALSEQRGGVPVTEGPASYIVDEAQSGPEHESPGQERTARIIDYFWSEERRSAFFKQFKELQTAYEVLSPDPYLVDYVDDYALIADVYQTTHSYFDTGADERRQHKDLLNKTEALISRHVQVSDVAEPLPLYPINRNIATVIENDQVPERVKVINLERSIIVHIQERATEQPYLVSIGEEVERIIEQLRQQQISAESVLSALQERAERMAEAEEERSESNLDNLSFSLRMVLLAGALTLDRESDINDLATSVAAYLSDHAGWQHNAKIASDVRLGLYKQLLPHVEKPINPDALKTIVDDLMKMHKITL